MGTDSRQGWNMKSLERHPIRLLQDIAYDDGPICPAGSTAFRGVDLYGMRMPRNGFHLCFGRARLKTDALEGVDFQFIQARPS